MKKYTLLTLLLFFVHLNVVVSQSNLVFTDSVKITKTNTNIRSNIEHWYSNENNIHISVLRTDGKSYIGVASLYYPNHSKYIEGYVNFKFTITIKENYLYIRYYNLIHTSDNISFGLLLKNQPNLSNNCYLHADICKVLWNDLIEYLTNHLMITTADLKYYFK